jgi:MoaA/NifB/PqqE/SkfB family radical SAM enzyme
MLARGSYVNFSLNAATRATYAAVNRGDHLDEVLDLARQFRSAVDQAGSAVRVDFSFVVTPRNVGEIADFIVLAADSRAHRVRFFFDLDQLPSEDEVRRAFVSADRTRRLFPLLPVNGLEVLAGRLFGTEVPADCLQSAGCRRTFHNLYVGVNGDVSFCNRLNWSPIGNIVGSELDEIWNSTVALEQRRAQAEGEWTFCSNASCGPTDRVWASRPDHPRLPARFARVE